MDNRANKTLLKCCLEMYESKFYLEEVVEMFNRNISDEELEECNDNYWERFLTFYDINFPEIYKNQAKLGNAIPLIYFPKRVFELERLQKLNKLPTFSFNLRIGIDLDKDKMWGFLRLIRDNGELIGYWYFNTDLTDDFDDIKKAIKLADTFKLSVYKNLIVLNYFQKEECFKIAIDKVNEMINIYGENNDE